MNSYIKHIIICASFLFTVVAQAQRVKECGSSLMPSEKETYANTVSAARQQAGRTQANYYYIRVFIHDFQYADGSDSAWSYEEVINEFNIASNLFSQYNMCLVLAGIDYPKNTAATDSFNKNLSAISYLQHDYAIDITLHKKLTDGSSNLNGTAYGIPGKWVSLSRGAINSRSFAHEIGHCLGLAHVFETVYCLECPDGSNNTECGDKIPDTRATPDADSVMEANTNASCMYTGNLTVYCNDQTQTWNPEVTNIMCYGRRSCRSFFSPGQLTVMRFVLENMLPGIWFDTPLALHLYTPLGVILINQDAYYAAPTILIGNNLPGINVNVNGNNTIQNFVSPGRIRLIPGVRLQQPNDPRGRVHLRIKPYCTE